MAEVILKDYEDEWGYEYVVGMGNNSGPVISSQIESFTGQPVTLRISSVGGSCYAAVEIINAIKKHGDVTAQIDGLAFSAAAVIAAACKSVTGTKYTMFMIHNSRINADMWGSFTAEDLRQLAEQSGEQMDAFDKLQAEIFAEKTGLPIEQIKEMLSQETWMTGTEAHDLGFIDTMTDGEVVAISRNLYDNAFAKAPMLMVAVAGKNLKINEKSNKMSSIAEEIKAQHNETKSLLSEIKAFFTGSKPVAVADVVAAVEKEEEKKEEVVEVEKTADELKAENEQLKADLAAANQKNEASDAALLEAKALTAETKTLLAEVKSNYQASEPNREFTNGKKAVEAKSERFSNLKNN